LEIIPKDGGQDYTAYRKLQVIYFVFALGQ